jgi:phenylacetate-CoA ligase
MNEILMKESQATPALNPNLTSNSSQYEKLRRRHISDFLTRVPGNMRPSNWPAERLKKERQERLRSLIRIAKTKSPWHGERLRNIDADSMTEADLAKIPVMTKPDLMANFDQIVTDKRLTLEMVDAHVSSLRGDRYLLDNYHVIASGGTSGFRGVFVYDWDEWTTLALSYRSAFLTINPLLWRLLSFRPIGKIFVNSRIKKKKARTAESRVRFVGVYADIASHMSNSLANSLFYPIVDREYPATLPIRIIVQGLNSSRPESLSAYPSMLYQLALEAKAGRLRIAPKRISSGGEPLLPYIQDLVRDVWGLPVSNFWVASEGGILSWSCGKGNGMHLNEDLQIIEPVDEQGRPVPLGVRASKIYLTNLYNHTMPIIRYEITDQITLLDEGSCACGSTFRRIDDIPGRLDDLFNYPGSITVHPIVFWSAFEHHPGVVEYQVRQTPKGASVILVASGPVDLERLESDIREYLTAAGLHDPEVSARIVERLERTAGAGKLKRFVPLTGSPSAVTMTPEVVA